MYKFAKLLAVALLVWSTVAMTANAAPDPATEATFKKLMTATVAADYDGFIAECDGTMKAALTKTQLEGVSKQIAPHLKGGYDSEYLGELKQRGYAVHLWRICAKDGSDDILTTMSLKDGKVGGFYLH